MNVGLWTAQVLLAIGFAVVGGMKAFMPLGELAQNMRWVADVPAGVVRFIGFAELVGAVGLIVPAATRIRPKLTPLAAVGLAVIVVLGAALHFTRGEGAMTPLNFLLAAVAAFVVWGRVRRAPIAPRR